MSYPKKPTTTKKPVAGPQVNSKLPDSKRDKLLAIQEREQLKGLLVNKFLEKYGKEKNVSQNYVNKQVTEFMKNEKVTEDNLKKLEQKIREGVGLKSVAPSQKGEESLKGQPQGAPSQKSQKSVKTFQEPSGEQAQHHHAHEHDDAVSTTSSQKPKSVYAQGDSDDEWATMMKYDTELFKKEKELERVREQEQKKKIKDELDRQIEEKKRLKNQEAEEERRYAQLMQRQMNQFDTKEHKKENTMKNKVMQEKSSRDQQLQEENLRKKLEKKKEKDMDEVLVRRIQEEMDAEAKAAVEKRVQDKENLKKLLMENEDNKAKAGEDARRNKEAEVRAQQEYIRLVEKQEADRDAELKAREDRTKQFMSMMADTVVKDQKEQILQEERTLLKHYLDREQREIEDENRRKERLNDQKKDMRKFLDQQVQDKERRKQEEAMIGKKQADIWKKDTEDYEEHERKKNEYIKDVNVQHAGFLQKQMVEERKRNKKMTPEEMLLNKNRLKEIADKGDENLKKQYVNPKK